MFRITEDPSSGSLVQCLAKITVMVLSCPLTWTRSVLRHHILTRCVCVCVCVCVVHCIGRHKLNYTHARTTGQNLAP